MERQVLDYLEVSCIIEGHTMKATKQRKTEGTFFLLHGGTLGGVTVVFQSYNSCHRCVKVIWYVCQLSWRCNSHPVFVTVVMEV